MAIKTNEIGSFAGGLVKALVDWNDANGSMTKGRVVNNSASPAHMEAALNPPINGWSLVALEAPANATTEVNFPNNTVKFAQVTDPDTGVKSWDLIGVSLFCRWPS